ITKEAHKRDKLVTRLQYSREQLTLSKDITHFYIHSTAQPQQYESSNTENGVRFLYDTFCKLSESLKQGDLP
ncbi:hypothetical protein KC573_01195, partial [candidate division WWE3 bacterium]|nr:hypothetical protein [candidate division WWE3 bacterium]